MTVVCPVCQAEIGEQCGQYTICIVNHYQRYQAAQDAIKAAQLKAVEESA